MGPEFNYEEVDLITALAIAIVAGGAAHQGSVPDAGQVFDTAESLVRERQKRYAEQLNGVSR